MFNYVQRGIIVKSADLSAIKASFGSFVTKTCGGENRVLLPKTRNNLLGKISRKSDAPNRVNWPVDYPLPVIGYTK